MIRYHKLRMDSPPAQNRTGPFPTLLARAWLDVGFERPPPGKKGKEREIETYFGQSLESALRRSRISCIKKVAETR